MRRKSDWIVVSEQRLFTEQKKTLQQAYGEWLGEYTWTYCVHLTARGLVAGNAERCWKAFQHFHRQVCRLAGVYVPCVAVLERGPIGHGAHVHALLYVPDGSIKGDVKDRFVIAWQYAVIREERGAESAGKWAKMYQRTPSMRSPSDQKRMRSLAPNSSRQHIEEYDPTRGAAYYLAKDTGHINGSELHLSKKMPPLLTSTAVEQGGAHAV